MNGSPPGAEVKKIAPTTLPSASMCSYSSLQLDVTSRCTLLGVDCRFACVEAQSRLILCGCYTVPDSTQFDQYSCTIAMLPARDGVVLQNFKNPIEKVLDVEKYVAIQNTHTLIHP